MLLDMSIPDVYTMAGALYFLETSTPHQIAKQLRIDRDRCRDQTFPSLLVHVLPSRDDKIAVALRDDDPPIPLPISRMLYSETISSIRTFLQTQGPQPRISFRKSPVPPHLIPTDEEYNAALKVLRYLQLPQVRALRSPTTPLEQVVQTIQEAIEYGPGVRFHQSDIDNMNRRMRAKKSTICYICRYSSKDTHKLYPSLCHPCGEFNIASSALSLPENMNLTGKVAVVTGARVNLGYHTALRLLRCGAAVIATSRYPYDAETRYANEEDFAEWKDRLKIVGADFRTAKDVFALVGSIKELTSELHILINNAAQTLTDAVEKEEEGIRREQQLLLDAPIDGVVVKNRYQAMIRGGNHAIQSANMERQALLIEGGEPQPAIKSSWTQKISEIPYEDVISAHSVNTFVPFILLRELLPLMPAKSEPPTAVPCGYVINVSSREGLFERTPHASAKSGMHVHTNMSKAALNMLTETEAALAWKKCSVAINSVDPGYMSADPMYMEMVGRRGQDCPISWEDGAGRVLWPIAKGEKGEVCWGRFLKHFKEIEVGR